MRGKSENVREPRPVRKTPYLPYRFPGTVLASYEREWSTELDDGFLTVASPETAYACEQREREDGVNWSAIPINAQLEHSLGSEPATRAPLFTLDQQFVDARHFPKITHSQLTTGRLPALVGQPASAYHCACANTSDISRNFSSLSKEYLYKKLYMTACDKHEDGSKRERKINDETERERERERHH